MASREQLFLALLRSDHIKDHLLPHLSISDICAIRQSSSACCNLLTKRVFTRVHVTFTANTFTKPCRVSALGRIGQHIEHLTFNFPHSQTTFLPPLIHPQTGNEISFLYTPHTSMDSALVRPKYANTELADILTQQYPPLFHAATNVPSFINAFHKLTNIRHLTVRCPGQNPAERYRRDIVDYALISLRIAVEKAPLMNLHKLSLSSLHPSALNYLRHVNGIGSVPSASRRWKQIRKLHMSIEAWDFSSATNPGLDHLKIIDDYIRQLAPRLEKLAFSWIGAAKGPCPIALSSDALFAPPRSSQKLFNELTSPHVATASPALTRPHPHAGAAIPTDPTPKDCQRVCFETLASIDTAGGTMRWRRPETINVSVIGEGSELQKCSTLRLRDLVCMTKDEAARHEKQILKAGVKIEELYDRETIDRVEAKMAQAAEYEKFRL
ncbi:hypothetical protein NQ176_g8144 [Zarea fungicola]|uniref:Uncharacterized protein n=1 Tax=Zarea fungicola TaxID=93591 RepID=A0ACC1MUM6_9HYPO|nr:hypothetical protein NQ176_g8144 [Lecanicillium fungicola]